MGRETAPSPLAAVAAIVAVIVGLFALVGALAWVFSFKGTDSGAICVVKESGPFDGRAVKEVRQPGSSPKPIGAWNKQHCLPLTERDSNDVLEQDPKFPTRDAVQVIADGQVLFTLTADAEKVEKFYIDYGRRKWGDSDLWSDDGWVNFLRQRFQPVVLDALRQTIGRYECTSLNNLCQYVQNPEAAAGKEKVKAVDTNQNLLEAAKAIQESLKERLRAAFGDDYFENVRFQNLRIRFEPEVQSRITKAQALRTEAANATLEAKRKVAEAEGDAQRRVEIAKGERAAAFQQERTYQLNPTKRSIDKIKAFCGEDGCDPRVVGNIGGVIANLEEAR